MNGQTLIRHKELLTPVNGGSFTSGQYKIQPGLASSFPWLSSIAPSYEMYSIVSLKYLFVSSCPTTERGTVYLAIDYDPADINDIISVEYISQLSGCTMDKVWNNNYVSLEQNKLRQNTRLYVRDGAVPSTSSIQNYDIGTLLYAVQGTTSVVVGNIFVEYVIALHVPCPYSDSIIQDNSIESRLTSNSSQVASANIYQTLADIDNASLRQLQQYSGPITLNDLGFFENITGTATNSLLTMVFEIATANTLATVASIATSLATRAATSTMLLYNPTTQLLTTGVLPYSISGGTTVPWQLSIITRVVSNALGQTLAMGGTNHVAAYLVNFTYARFFLSPFYFIN